MDCLLLPSCCKATRSRAWEKKFRGSRLKPGCRNLWRAGFRVFVADLPWERAKRLRALRAEPLELVSLNLVNTSRDGTPLSEVKDSYTLSEVQYLTWEVCAEKPAVRG